MLFGDVIDSKMVLNELGKIVENEWLKTSEIRKNINIDEYAIMPNHLHGIIGIIDDPEAAVRANSHKPQRDTQTSGKGTIQSETEVYDKVRANFNSPQPSNQNPPTFKSPSKTIGAFIRGFKSAVTKKINIKRNTPGATVWQRNYYERIIRDEPELNRIKKYIVENPAKWQEDKYYI